MIHRIHLAFLLGILLLAGCSKDEPNTEAAPNTGIPDDAAPAEVRSRSFYIINEDCFGRQNGTVNRIWFDGHITYRAYRKANPGLELGVTTQFAMNYGGNIYFMSKQGQRFVVADAETLEKKASFEYIGDENGGDGRACVGVDPHTVYVGTSRGIRIFDIPSLRFTGKITDADESTDLYSRQTGDMIRIGDRVFAVMQGKGILVIDTRTHQVETVIEPKTTGGVCQSRDGLLWVSGNPLKAYDPYTLEVQKTVVLPTGDTGGGAGWGAWHSASLCSSTQHNTIYWQGRDDQEWSDAAGIFKYDIDNARLSHVMELSSYGVIRIDPLTDYITTVDGTLYDDNGVVQREFSILGGTPNSDGTVDDESTGYPYWFSTLPLFEDANRPAIRTNQIVMASGGERAICLSDMVMDRDNISRSIRKEVIFDPGTLLESQVRADTLYLKASGGKGETHFTLRVESNGFEAEKKISVDIR